MQSFKSENKRIVTAAEQGSKHCALHLRSRIKGLPDVITLVPFPRADLFSQFKCHEISCKELGWIPNKQSCLFIPDKGSGLRNFKPLVCQQMVQKVGFICYEMIQKCQPETNDDLN